MYDIFKYAGRKDDNGCSKKYLEPQEIFEVAFSLEIFLRNSQRKTVPIFLFSQVLSASCNGTFFPVLFKAFSDKGLQQISSFLQLDEKNLSPNQLQRFHR